MLKFNEENLAKLRTFEDLFERNMASLVVWPVRSLMQEPRHGIVPSY